MQVFAGVADVGTPVLVAAVALVVVLVAAGVGVYLWQRRSQPDPDEWTRDDLLDLTPDEFEHIVARAWREQGYETEVTAGSRDRGIDVVCTKNGMVSSETVVVQAKRYGVEKTVGRPTIQQTAGAMLEHGADKAAVVTSAEFTRPAQESAETLDVELMDGEDLVAHLNDHQCATTVPSET